MHNIDPYYVQYLFVQSDKLRIQLGGLAAMMLTTKMTQTRMREVSLLVAALQYDIKEIEAELTSYACLIWQHDAITI